MNLPQKGIFHTKNRLTFTKKPPIEPQLNRGVMGSYSLCIIRGALDLIAHLRKELDAHQA